MIAVSDAQRGHVSMVDPIQWLYMPAASATTDRAGVPICRTFAANRGKVIVLSTIGSRMIEFEGDGRPIRSYSLADICATMMRRPMMLPLACRRRIIMKLTQPSRFSTNVYAQLVSCTGRKLILPRPEDDIFSGGGYFYFSKVVNLGDGIIVSPQTLSRYTLLQLKMLSYSSRHGLV
jgi:hypothetical protein